MRDYLIAAREFNSPGTAAAIPARFANFLHAQGVRLGDCVPGMLPRNVELPIPPCGKIQRFLLGNQEIAQGQAHATAAVH